MKLKIFGISLVIFGLILSTGISFAASKKAEIPSSFLYQAVMKYKHKNYTGCIQDMDYIIQKGRPTDIVYYYKAISYSQLGMNEEAKAAYQAAVGISKDMALIEYSNQAILCIDDPSTCTANLDNSDITKFIKSEQFMHPEVQAGIQAKAIEKAKADINAEIRPTEKDLKYLNMNNDTTAPSDKEIADAVRTLSKLGMTPFNSNQMAMYGGNNEYAQLSMLLGNNNNNGNNMMNLIPMLSAMQTNGGKSNISKEFVQSYMMNQMLPSFNFGSDDK